MTTLAFPLDPVAGAPSYSAGNLRQAFSALMGQPPSGRPLGVNSGVRPGTPSSTVSATTTTWTVGTFSAIVDAESAAAAGPYFVVQSNSGSGSMTAANASFGRIDLISIQVSDTSQGDGTGAASAQIVYTTGTASASPAVPSAPARSYTLAQILVPQSGTGSPSVTWVATGWDDTGWILSGITPATGVTLTSQRYRKMGNRVTVFGIGTLGSTVAANIMASVSKLGDYGNQIVATMPSGYIPAMTQGLAAGTSGPPFTFAVNAGSGYISLDAGPATTAAGGIAVVTSTTPFSFSGTYLMD